MSRARSPAPEPRLATTALLVGLALLVGRGQGRFPESPLVDTSVWSLQTPDLAGRMSRMREAITGPPDEAKRRWARMMKARRIAPPPRTRPPGAGPTGGLGSSGNFTFAVAPGNQVPSLVEGVVKEALARKHQRIAGSGDLGPMLRQSGGGPPSLLRRRGPQVGEPERVYPAGRTERMPVLQDDLTRWERGKEVLKALGRAYVVQDIGEFMRQFSINAALDLTILRNAVQEDFEQDADIQLDFELLEYRISFESIHVRLRWLRSSTLQNGTPAAVTEGTSDLLLDRHDRFRIKSWRGLPPFGARDQAFLDQVRAGAPNALLEGNLATSGTPSPSPPPTGPPPVAPIIDLGSFVFTSTEQICINFDNLPTAQVEVPTSSCSISPTVLLNGNPGMTNQFTVADPLGIGSLEACNPAIPLDEYRDMTTPAQASVTADNSQAFKFSQFTGNNHVIFEVSFIPDGTGGGQVAMRYMQSGSSTDQVVNAATGTQTCP